MSVGKGLKFPLATTQQKQPEKSLDYDEMEKLKSNIEILEHAKVTLTKKLRVDVDFWQNKCKKLEEELQGYRNRLSNKEKESNIVMSRFNELKRRATVYSL